MPGESQVITKRTIVTAKNVLTCLRATKPGTNKCSQPQAEQDEGVINAVYWKLISVRMSDPKQVWDPESPNPHS